MAQQERARVTRAKIMQGAAEVIRRVGYANATLGDIGEAAGVTRGAMYFHFESKEDIARALIEEQHHTVREAATQILSRDASALEHMMRLSADLAARLTTDPIVRAGVRLTTDSSTFDKPMLDPYEDWTRMVHELAVRAELNKEISNDIPPKQLARFIVPAFTGLQLVSESYSGRADLIDRVHEMWQILVRAVVPSDQVDTRLRLAHEVFTSQRPAPATQQRRRPRAPENPPARLDT